MCDNGFELNDKKACVACADVNCHRCAAGKCLVCKENLAKTFFLTPQGECSTTCEGNTFPNDVNYKCDSCPTGCTTCTSIAKCTGCE